MDRFDWLELEQARASRTEAPYKPRTEPHDAATFYGAAREMREHGYLKAAADFYEKAIGFDDHHYDAWLELIDTLVRTKELERASARSKEAIDTYRLVRPFYAARALVLAHLGQFQDAYYHSKISITREEPSWYAFCVQAEINLKESIDKRLDALGFYEAAMECAESRWEPPFLAGWALLEARLPALAAGMFAEAAHHNPRAPICWLGLGDSFLALRLYEQALFYYQRVTELEPHHEGAVERQRKCVPLSYGLLGSIQPRLMQDRWKRKFQKALKERGPKRS